MTCCGALLQPARAPIAGMCDTVRPAEHDAAVAGSVRLFRSIKCHDDTALAARWDAAESRSQGSKWDGGWWRHYGRGCGCGGNAVHIGLRIQVGIQAVPEIQECQTVTVADDKAQDGHQGQAGRLL